MADEPNGIHTSVTVACANKVDVTEIVDRGNVVVTLSVLVVVFGGSVLVTKKFNVSRCVITAVTVRNMVRDIVCSKVNPGRKAVDVITAPGKRDVVVTVWVWTTAAGVNVVVIVCTCALA